MNLKSFVLSIFSGLSRLYPKEYQKEYSEEMKSVFLDILEDSGNSGNWHAIQCLLRECFYLPGCLVREYLSNTGGGRMKSTRQILSVTTLAFISLFILFAVMNEAYWSLTNFAGITQPGFRVLWLIFDGIISGILAGGAIGFALSVKNKVPTMVMCGLGFIAGRLLTEPGYWDMLGIPTGWVNSDWGTALVYAASPVTGLFVGVLVGLLWKGWKSGIVFGLASSLIFSIALLGNYSSANFLVAHGILQIVDPKFASDTLRLFLFSLITYSIFGGIAGILWGVLLDRLPRMQWLRPSSNG
jgi:hypothetical protein